MNHKILVMLLYHKQPTSVRIALSSVLRAGDGYPHWQLAFHDYNSSVPGESIAREFIPKSQTEKLSCYRTHLLSGADQKPNSGFLGMAINRMMKDSKADIAILLTEDNVLHHNYFVNLNQFFNTYPNLDACYCHVMTFQPDKEDWRDAKMDTAHPLNAFSNPINAYGKLDSSQIAWRLRASQKHNVWSPEHKNEPSFFEAMYDYMGTIPFLQRFGQYKAIYTEETASAPVSEPVAKKPVDVEVQISRLLHTARNLFNDRDFKQARDLVQQILWLDPSNTDAQFMHFTMEEEKNW